MINLPDSFIWGAATAAYQIEGGASEGGRTPSIWDTFSHTPGNVERGETGDVAADHYHRYEADLDLLADLGVDAYRLSISWSRVMPGGRGPLNPEGVDFYRRLLTGLRERGILPVVTLYHWDLPQELQDTGGWPERATAEAFADYARVMAREFGDLVHTWTTLNEPWCTAFVGYASGVHAPGITDAGAALAAAHHLNLAHGLATRTIREELGEDARISITLNLHVIDPADEDNSADLAAAEKASLVGNKIFLGPLLDGTYPTALLANTRHLTDWSFVRAGDLNITRTRLDVLGVNYYSTNTVRHAEGGGGKGVGEHSPWPGCEDVEFLAPTGPLTTMGWNIEPRGLYDLLTALDTAYEGLPLAVTENGAAFDDVVTADGRIHDERRVAYLKDHLAEISAAVADGADVRGYFVWSLLDNFEWSYGYAKRFGIVHVDYETQQRRLKDSALFYRGVIAEHHTRRAERSPELAADGGLDDVWVQQAWVGAADAARGGRGISDEETKDARRRRRRLFFRRG
ncbi:beta-glucosidase [Bowdeniella nasicola]|uniref:Beta-glucosidase n=1 Tax=Bowdeniella nasicola TaxID=208480 RepID=A0A1Q5Q2X9_9ACTO|nr:GH1 family beta-glucosidase [Bowdeniella nasicola]OKL54198.1 beta-glucosidase [Bowdeniella nasicola]